MICIGFRKHGLTDPFSIFFSSSVIVLVHTGFLFSFVKAGNFEMIGGNQSRRGSGGCVSP